MIGIKFKISAPGSLILYGDHMIMYEKHVVTASLDLRTTIEFCELTSSKNIIEIEFPDVNLSLNLSLEGVLNYFFANTYFNPMTDHILLLKHVQYFITSNGMWNTYEQKFSLQIFLFLLLYIVYKEEIDIKSFHVRLTTELPIKAGLGSSTSFAVCIAACFLHWARLQRGVRYNIFNEEELNDISEYVEYCEEVVQKYTLGMYHEVCIYGQIIRFRYSIQEGSNIRLLKVPRMKILLIDSRIRRNKYQLMELTAMIYSSNEFVRDTFDKIDQISRKASYQLAQIYDIQQSNNLDEIRNIYLSLNVSFCFGDFLYYFVTYIFE